MRPFRELRVWQVSHDLTLDVYDASKGFPRDELFGLTGQLRRSAASVPANIAEGSARGSDADTRRFLSVALGSAAELEYHLILARDLGYLSPGMYEALDSKVREVKRMLVTFRQRLAAPDESPPSANGQRLRANGR